MDAGIHDDRARRHAMYRERLCNDRIHGTTFVHVVKLLAILHGLRAMRDLGRQRTHVLLAHGGELALCGPYGQAAASAVIAHAGVVHVHDLHVVDVGDLRDVDVGDGAVVHEAVVIPIAAMEAITGVAIAVGDSAIEADVRSPVAMMPAIEAS